MGLIAYHPTGAAAPGQIDWIPKRPNQIALPAALKEIVNDIRTEKHQQIRQRRYPYQA